MSSTISTLRTPAWTIVVFALSAAKYILAAYLPESGPDDVNRQWVGNCQRQPNGFVCGKDIDHFCEEATKLCENCGVYCSKAHFDDTMCREVCPAWYAQNQTPSPSSQPPAGTEEEPTTNAEYISSVTPTEQSPTDITTSITPDTFNDESHMWMYRLGISLVAILIVAIIIVCVVKRYMIKRMILDLFFRFQNRKSDIENLPNDQSDDNREEDKDINEERSLIVTQPQEDDDSSSVSHQLLPQSDTRSPFPLKESAAIANELQQSKVVCHDNIQDDKPRLDTHMTARLNGSEVAPVQNVQ